MYKKIAPLLVLCSFELFAAPLRIAPQAKDDTASVIVGVNPSVTLNPMANDRYGSIVTINGSTSGQYGYLSSTGTTYTLYDNDANAALAAGQIVTDTFTYTYANDVGQTATALIIISVSGNQKKTPVTLAPVPPVANDDYVTLVPNTFTKALSVSGNVSNNDKNWTSFYLESSPTSTPNVCSPPNPSYPATATPPCNTKNSPAGVYGNLVLDPDGKFIYTLNKDAPNVLALTAGLVVTDIFSYVTTNTYGQIATAKLYVKIIGNPVDANGNTIFVPPVDVPLDNVDVEFNNRSAQATPLNSGRNIKGSLYDGEDKDWYFLQSTGNEIINLDLCPKGSSCFGKKSWVVYVFDSAKLTVAMEEQNQTFRRWVTDTGNFTDLQGTDILGIGNTVGSSNHLYLAYRLGFFEGALIGVIDPCFGEDSTLSIGVGKPSDPRNYFIAVSSPLMGTPAGQCGGGDIVLQKQGVNALGKDADGKAKTYATTEEYVTVFPYRDDQYVINITGTGINPLLSANAAAMSSTFSATTGVLNIPQVMISNAPYSVSLTLQNQPVTLNAPIANSTASTSSLLKYTLSGIQGLDPTKVADAFHATYNSANQQLLIPRVTDTVSGKAYSVAMQYHPAVGSNAAWLEMIDYLLIQ
jgi:VCBS repeat-containing protein